MTVTCHDLVKVGPHFRAEVVSDDKRRGRILPETFGIL